MKTNVILILLGCTILSSCEQGGFEIYLTRVTSPDYTLENSSKDCEYCFHPTLDDLMGKPLLTESDIEYFDWENQQIVLNQVGNEKIQELSIPLQGISAAIVLNKEVIYGFWFWNKASSFGCDWVCTWPSEGFEMRFGLPSRHAKGDDPRENDILADYVMNKMNMN